MISNPNCPLQLRENLPARLPADNIIFKYAVKDVRHN
jgi:hypothetical protein